MDKKYSGSEQNPPPRDNVMVAPLQKRMAAISRVWGLKERNQVTSTTHACDEQVSSFNYIYRSSQHLTASFRGTKVCQQHYEHDVQTRQIIILASPATRCFLVCFDPGLTLKCWQGLYFYLIFLGRVGNFCLGRVRVCHPELQTPIRNLVKSPPPWGWTQQKL